MWCTALWRDARPQRRRGTTNMAPGDPIFVDRGTHEHHGLDLGDGWVIHYQSATGSKADSRVGITTSERFKKDGVVQVVRYGMRLAPATSLARAYASLGNGGYHVLTNNCEHFA